MTAQLIVAAASRRCALTTVTAANKAAIIEKISLSGIILDRPWRVHHKAQILRPFFHVA